MSADATDLLTGQTTEDELVDQNVVDDTAVEQVDDTAPVEEVVDDAGEVAEPAAPTIDENLRKKYGNIFTDDQLAAFGDAPDRADAAAQAVYESILRFGPPGATAPSPEATKPAEPIQPSAPAKPADRYAVTVDEDAFQDKPAATTAAMLQGMADHLSQQIAQMREALTPVIQSRHEEAQRSQTAQANEVLSSVERVRKELGPEFSNVFGAVPIRLMLQNPNSPQFAALDKLVKAMALIDERTGRGGPATWDADYARGVMLASKDPDFVSAVNRASRKKTAAALNGKARGATPAPAARRAAPKPKTWDEEKRELKAAARKEIGF